VVKSEARGTKPPPKRKSRGERVPAEKGIPEYNMMRNGREKMAKRPNTASTKIKKAPGGHRNKKIATTEDGNCRATVTIEYCTAKQKKWDANSEEADG